MISSVGIGIDIEPTSRFAEPDARIFTPDELAYCAASADPQSSRAGRWCAKEAVVKAMSKHVLLGLREIEILTAQDGRPVVRVLRPELADAFECDVSISYSDGVAVAVALAWPAEHAVRGGTAQG